MIKNAMVRRALGAVARICSAARMLRRRLLVAKFNHWYQEMRTSAAQAQEVSRSLLRIVSRSLLRIVLNISTTQAQEVLPSVFPPFTCVHSYYISYIYISHLYIYPIYIHVYIYTLYKIYIYSHFV